MYLVRISAPAPCGRNRGTISPGRVRTATPYFSDCPNQCAALYLVRILSAARCAGFRQAKSPGRVGRCRIPQRKSLRRMSGAFSLCLRCFPLSDRVQPGQRMYLVRISAPAPCGRNRGAISPGKVRTATPYFSDSPNQCAAFYLCLGKQDTVEFRSICL